MLPDLGTKLMIVLSAIVIAGSAAASEHSLHVHFRSQQSCAGVVKIADTSSESIVSDVNVSSAENDELVLPRPRGEAVSVSLVSQDCWSPLIEVTAESTDVTIPTWPRSSLVVRLAGNPLTATQAQLDVLVETVSGERIAGSPVPCAAAKGGVWECPTPIGTLNLRLSAPGYAPRYLFGLAVRPEERLDLGTIELMKGASVSGRVNVSGPSDGMEEVTVTLSPTYRTPSRPDIATRHASANNEGFFQFSSVPAGSYEAVATKRGWSSSTPTSIRVVDGEETVVKGHLVVEPLAKLNLTVQPPVYDSGHDWNIRIEREGSRRGQLIPVSDETVPVTGLYERDSLERGRYRVTIRDPFGSVVARERLEVSAGYSSYNITISTFPIKGRVTLGDEPLDARIRFSWKDGSTLLFDSNAEGLFHGVLTHEGKWRVEILPKGRRRLRIQSRTESIEAANEGAARVDIVLPGGLLEGMVVDVLGKPSQAQVLLTRDGQVEAIDATSADGHFNLVGVDKGAAVVTAIGEDATSGPVAVFVEESQNELVRLVLHGTRHIDGRIVTAGGLPVAGVLLRYTTPAMIDTKETVSGPSGEFRLAVPGPGDFVTVVALSPGMPTKEKSFPTTESGGMVELPMGGASATLVVALPGVPPWPFITTDGYGFVGLRFLNPPVSGGGTLFGNLGSDGFEYVVEPGRYIICPEETVSRACGAVFLSPGERAVVDGRRLWREEPP